MLDLTKVKKRNICIMGLMGSGKSIVGKELAKHLNVNFYDIDREIELKTKKKINTIFHEEGELYFRNIEEKICLELLVRDNCIIALGGGSITHRNVRNAIKKNSFLIYLQVNLINLLERLKSSKRRPLLNSNQNKRKTLEKLYHERKRFYKKADFIVNNDNDKLQVIEEIKLRIYSYAR